MKTGGAVEALGKERIKSNLTQRNVKTARRFSGMYGAADLKNKCNIPVVKPNDKFRVVWDIMGISLIVMDAFLLPASIAWDLDVTPFPRKISFGSRVLQVFAAVAMFFWPVDSQPYRFGLYQGLGFELGTRPIMLISAWCRSALSGDDKVSFVSRRWG